MAPLSRDSWEEWDDDEDGEWEPPKIDNPAFKGEWSPRMIANPAYSGKWIARMIPNPDFVDNPDLYKYDNIGYVGASSCGTFVVETAATGHQLLLLLWLETKAVHSCIHTAEGLKRGHHLAIKTSMKKSTVTMMRKKMMFRI